MSQEDDELDEITVALAATFRKRLAGLEIDEEDEDEESEEQVRPIHTFEYNPEKRRLRVTSSEGGRLEVPIEEFHKLEEHLETRCFSCEKGELDLFVNTRDKPGLFLICDNRECEEVYRVIEGELRAIGK